MPGLLDFLQSGAAQDVGLGLLSAAGPSTMPVSTGQALLEGVQFASQRDRARAENELIRNRINQQNQKQAAMSEIQGLLGQTTPAQLPGTPVTGLEGESLGIIPGMRGEVPVISTPQGQNQMLGLLGQIAPEQVATGLLGSMFPGQGRAEPPEVRIARVLADPNESPEVQEHLRAQIADQGNEALLNTIEAQRAMIELEQSRNELEQQNRTQRQREQAVADNFVNTLERADSLLEANNKLEGTALETGRVDPGSFREFLFKSTNEIKEAFGGDTQAADELITARNTFQKNASGFAIDLVANLENATNQKFETLRGSIANLGVDPATNRAIIADVVRRAMQEAERANINIPRGAIDRANDLIRRASGAAGTMPPIGQPGGAINYSDLPD